MMKILAIAFLILASTASTIFAKTIVIAVIDTGIDAASNSKLCKFGHKSFVKSLPNPLQDTVGHGTHVAGIIAKTAGQGNYCIVSIKYHNPDGVGMENSYNLAKSIQYATDIKVDFMNISAGGKGPASYERDAIERALDSGIKVVVAAGNEHDDLDKDCNYFPACYDTRIILVGNLENNQTLASSSNYGNRITRWEIGQYVMSTLPGGHTGYMSGTSQATAVATGKLVRNALRK